MTVTSNEAHPRLGSGMPVHRHGNAHENGNGFDRHPQQPAPEAAQQTAPARPSGLAMLTATERIVLARMARGESNTGIAQALGVTVRAIEKHVNAIFSKFDLRPGMTVHRRVVAVLRYLAETGTAPSQQLPQQLQPGSPD